MRNSFALAEILILLLLCAYPSPQATAAESESAQVLSAENLEDRIRILVGDKLFTEYLFGEDLKYPYFYPVNGPAFGQSVTTHKTQPYPHHSSLFFGCDRVNGGNYWQEDLSRGRIDSLECRLLQKTGPEIVLSQKCRWQRPGAKSPFDDDRKITVRAPSASLREIDFEIELTARIPVRIEKNNHSLFAARMAPDLAVTSGGTLINSHGQQAEAGTFGQKAEWAHFSGLRVNIREGLAILTHPQNRWHPSPWFTRNYGFFSPTPMQWLDQGHIDFATGEKLRLRYRVIIHSGELAPTELNAIYKQWTDVETTGTQTPINK